MIQGLFYASLVWLSFDRLYEVEIGVVSFTGFYLAIIVLSVLASIQVAIGRSRFRWTPVDSAIAAVGVLYLPSTLLSDDYMTAGFLAFRGIFIPVLTYFVAKALLQTDAQIRRAIFAYSAGLAVLSAVAVVQLVSTGERPIPLGQDPVSVASLAGLPLMIGLFSGQQLANRRWRVLLVAAGGLGVMVSLTRAYWIFAVLSPFVFRLFRKRKAFQLTLGMFVVSLLATLVVTLSWSSYFGDARVNFHETRGIERILNWEHWRVSMDQRIQYMYKPSLESFLESPLLGNGLVVQEGVKTTTHNFHLEWLESGGMLGYLAFVSIYLLSFFGLSKDEAAHDRLLIAIGLATFALLLSGLTNGVMHSVIPICLMLNLGMASARSSTRTSGARSPTFGTLHSPSSSTAIREIRSLRRII